MPRFLSRFHNTDLGILFARVALGVVFINAGIMKIANIDFVLSGFASIGIPTWLSYVVIYGELITGILVVLGLFVRYAGVFLAVVMVVAGIKAHFMNGFSLANNGYEYVFVLFFVSVSLFLLGAGKYSLDYFLKRK